MSVPPSLRPFDPARMPRLPRPADIASLSVPEVRRVLDIAYNPSTLAVVVFALDAGLYEACREPSDASEIAERVSDDASDVAIEIAVQLSCGLGLLERRGERVCVTETARRFLLGDSPVRLTGLLRRHQHYLRDGLGSLTRAIDRATRSTSSLWTADATRQEHEEHFAIRQHFNEASMVYFADTAVLLLLTHRALDLGAHRVVCDVGSGPGAFAALLKNENPAMHVRAVDVSLRYESYRERVALWLSRQGCDVELCGLDVLHDPLPSDHDLVFVNRLVTAVPKDAVGPWLRKLHDALVPGGRLVFGDYFFTGDLAHDFNVTSVYVYWATSDLLAREEVAREGGGARPEDPRVVWGWLSRWSCAELAEALRAAGFADVSHRAGLSPFAVVEAVRP